MALAGGRGAFQDDRLTDSLRQIARACFIYFSYGSAIESKRLSLHRRVRPGRVFDRAPARPVLSYLGAAGGHGQCFSDRGYDFTSIRL